MAKREPDPIKNTKALIPDDIKMPTGLTEYDLVDLIGRKPTGDEIEDTNLIVELFNNPGKTIDIKKDFKKAARTLRALARQEKIAGALLSYQNAIFVAKMQKVLDRVLDSLDEIDLEDVKYSDLIKSVKTLYDCVAGNVSNGNNTLVNMQINMTSTGDEMREKQQAVIEFITGTLQRSPDFAKEFKQVIGKNNNSIDTKFKEIANGKEKESQARQENPGSSNIADGRKEPYVGRYKGEISDIRKKHEGGN